MCKPLPRRDDAPGRIYPDSPEPGAENMKCPTCGTENDAAQSRCRKCSSKLTAAVAKPTSVANVASPRSAGISPDDVARKLKMDYSHAAKDEADRYLECVQQISGQIVKPKHDSRELVDQAAKLIFKQFHIKEVAIGLRSASDGRFRYIAMQGMRANIWAQHTGLSYSHESFFSNSKYKGTLISKLTKLLLAEDEPYDDEEKKTYNEHLMRSSRRRAPDDSIEGDYLDTLIYGIDGSLLGWIEISGTWDDRLPSARAIRAIEIIANLMGIALSRDPAIAGTQQPDSNNLPRGG